MENLYLTDSKEWRRWLKKNHKKESAVFLVFYKKETKKESIKYEAAVEEALCYGWIDSIIKKIDSESYVRKFTPRKDNSKWSESNKKRVKKIIEENRMTSFGMRKIEIAKLNGQWFKLDKPDIKFKITNEFKTELKKNKKAKITFEQLAESYKKQYLDWIFMAKRKETKPNRIKKAIKLLANGKKLGLK